MLNTFACLTDKRYVFPCTVTNGRKARWEMPSLSSYHPLPHQRATPNVGSANRPVEKKISEDFAGPFPNKDMALVFWDQYSRYPVVEFVTSTSAEAVIPQLTRVFTTYGIPEEVKTDNGLLFNGPNLRNMPKNKGSGTERSHRGGRRQMVTSNASCRQSKRARELLRLKGKLLDKRFKGRLATIVPHPIL